MEEIFKQEHKAIPTQWIEVDKNTHLKQSGEYTSPEYKFRFVACGQFESATGLRTDSPTCDVDGLNLILSLAASRGNTVRSADVRNAYFQGKKLERVLLLRPPKGGLPGEEDLQHAAIRAKAPIYGTRDAGRMFWKRLREVLIGAGMRPNKYIKALYVYEKDGAVKARLDGFERRQKDAVATDLRRAGIELEDLDFCSSGVNRGKFFFEDDQRLVVEQFVVVSH